MHAVVERCSLPPSLQDNEVVVVSVALPGNHFAMDSLAALLSEEEMSRVARFRHLKDRNVFIVSRGLLRASLGYYLNIDPRNVCFSYTAQGKPQLDPVHHADTIEFNVSHTEGLIAIAFSRSHRVGIDVEKPREILDELEIAERFFTREEASHLRSLAPADRRAAFLGSWTRREAYAKVTGRGLAEILEQALPEETAKEMAGFSFHPLSLEADYVGVVAVEGDAPLAQHVRFTSLDGLLCKQARAARP